MKSHGERNRPGQKRELGAQVGQVAAKVRFRCSRYMVLNPRRKVGGDVIELGLISFSREP